MNICPVKCQSNHQLSLDPLYTSPTQYDKDSTELSFSIDLTSNIINPASMALSYGEVFVWDSDIKTYLPARTHAKFIGMFNTYSPVVTVTLPTTPVEFSMTDFYVKVTSYTCASINNAFRSADTTNLEESRLLQVTVPFKFGMSYCTSKTYGVVSGTTLVFNKNKG